MWLDDPTREPVKTDGQGTANRIEMAARPFWTQCEHLLKPLQCGDKLLVKGTVMFYSLLVVEGIWQITVVLGIGFRSRNFCVHQSFEGSSLSYLVIWLSPQAKPGNNDSV